MKTSRGYAFRISSNKESAAITCVLAEIQRWAEAWNAPSWEQGKASGVPWCEAIGMGKLEVGQLEEGTYVIG